MATIDSTFTAWPRHWQRYWLPYHFEPMPHPRYKHVYLPLNRQYKPLGIIPAWPHVNYEDYSQQFIRFHRDPHTFKDVWLLDPRGHLFLYDDGEKSRSTYFARLDRLCRHKMTMVEFSVRDTDA